MTRNNLPDSATVQSAADQLLRRHRDNGAYPSVSALAESFDINRSTFYRHFSDITDAMLNTAALQHTDRTRRRSSRADKDDSDATITRLRSENTDLRRHLEIYEEQIRMLTIDNHNLRGQLKQRPGVTVLPRNRRR